MKLDYIKQRKELASVLLFGVSVFLAIVIFIEMAGCIMTSARAEKLAQDAVSQSKPDPNEVETYFAKSREIADGLKKKNLFAPPPPKKHPVSQVSGILGDEVLIGDKWYKLGDKIGDAKIVAIEPTYVKIEWEGKEKVFAPISAAGTAAPMEVVKEPVVEEKVEPEKIAAESPKRVEPPVVKEKIEPKKIAAPAPKPVEVEVAVAPQDDDPFAFLGVELPPAVRAKLLEMWNNMSDQQKEEAKREWNNMPEEQKQQAIDQMQQHIDQM